MSSCRPLRPIRQESIADLLRWYPEVREPPPPGTFEIALVLTGGQSAGCYLAGVMDFLFEALDAWHRARRDDPGNTPNHDVKVKIIVGASAGGLNAALAAVAAPYRWRYATHHKFEHRNRNLGSPFYRAWVRDVDISNLLTTDDLERTGRPLSILNSEYLRNKVRDYLDFTGEGVEQPEHRAWLDDPLPIKIATSNVSGVPYGIRFTGEQGATGTSYQMGLHRDYLAFQRPIFRSPPAPGMPDHEPLSADNRADHPGWCRLGRAVLATIAFPVALAERVVERPSTDYEYRFASVSQARELAYAEPFPGSPACQVRSVAVDGGLMDNEPFDLAHAALAGADGRNERAGDVARRAVIMIDPFVSGQTPERREKPTAVLLAIKNIWQALISQSQFKLEDLALADADEVYSRFLIGPVRHEAGKTIRGDSALASHPLNHYFGYFSEHYRHHDFMLGRRNCYHFLRDWFVLPRDWNAAIGNKLFDRWPQHARRNSSFMSQAPSRVPHWQIIPLVGTAAAEPSLYPWPRGKFQGFAAIESQVATRVNALYARLRNDLTAVIKTRFGRWSGKILISLAWRLKGRAWLTGKIRDAVDHARARIERG
jgi:predicted acylesterase/phospholipase RssA